MDHTSAPTTHQNARTQGRGRAGVEHDHRGRGLPGDGLEPAELGILGWRESVRGRVSAEEVGEWNVRDRIAGMWDVGICICGWGGDSCVLWDVWYAVGGSVTFVAMRVHV